MEDDSLVIVNIEDANEPSPPTTFFTRSHAQHWLTVFAGNILGVGTYLACAAYNQKILGLVFSIAYIAGNNYFILNYVEPRRNSSQNAGGAPVDYLVPWSPNFWYMTAVVGLGLPFILFGSNLINAVSGIIVTAAAAHLWRVKRIASMPVIIFPISALGLIYATGDGEYVYDLFIIFGALWILVPAYAVAKFPSSPHRVSWVWILYATSTFFFFVSVANISDMIMNNKGWGSHWHSKAVDYSIAAPVFFYFPLGAVGVATKGRYLQALSAIGTVYILVQTIFITLHEIVDKGGLRSMWALIPSFFPFCLLSHSIRGKIHSFLSSTTCGNEASLLAWGPFIIFSILGLMFFGMILEQSFMGGFMVSLFFDGFLILLGQHHVDPEMHLVFGLGFFGTRDYDHSSNEIAPLPTSVVIANNDIESDMDIDSSQQRPTEFALTPMSPNVYYLMVVLVLGQPFLLLALAFQDESKILLVTGLAMVPVITILGAARTWSYKRIPSMSLALYISLSEIFFMICLAVNAQEEVFIYYLIYATPFWMVVSVYMLTVDPVEQDREMWTWSLHGPAIISFLVAISLAMNAGIGLVSTITMVLCYYTPIGTMGIIANSRTLLHLSVGGFAFSLFSVISEFANNSDFKYVLCIVFLFMAQGMYMAYHKIYENRAALRYKLYELSGRCIRNYCPIFATKAKNFAIKICLVMGICITEISSAVARIAEAIVYAIRN